MVYPGRNCLFFVILGLDTNAVCVELSWSVVVVSSGIWALLVPRRDGHVKYSV